MDKREFLRMAAVGTLASLWPSATSAAVVEHGAIVSLRNVDGGPGKSRFLIGHVGNGRLDFAPELSRTHSGTKWKVFTAGSGFFAFECRGLGQGPRWLEARAGGVHLAAQRQRPYSGTAWRALPFPGSTADYVVECEIVPRQRQWLRGTPGQNMVDLVPADSAVAGTRWTISRYPECIDPPCDPWFRRE